MQQLSYGGIPTTGLTAPDTALRRYSRGELVLQAGDPAVSVCAVLAGRVRVYLLARSGEETTVALLGPGQWFGFASLLELECNRVFVEATTQAVVWTVPASRVLRALPGDAALLQQMVGGVCLRLAHAEALLRDVALLPVAARIPKAMARLQRSLGSGDDQSVTREHLAGLIGARRETVSRAVAGVPPTPPPTR